ncbi:hypothetical protein [Streptomyces sp. NPDC050263]|uniref:hypothetical protein n=1 Tax=Streptomyces sp. NPDC050263 TaxID=3155037 RepID=UPI003429B603
MPMLAVTMLAGLITFLAPPQPASAGVEDFRPVTYNMQGGNTDAASKWQTDVPQMVNAGYNIIALQEAGPRPPAASRLVWTSRYLGETNAWAGWRVQEYEWDPFPRSVNLPWHIYWLRTDFGGNRVNLAIITPFDSPEVFLVPPAFYGRNGLPSSRPALGIRVDQTLFFTVHAMSGNGAGNDGPDLLSRIAGVAGTRQWAAMGDWNREPRNLVVRRGWHKYTAGRPTHINTNPGPNTVNRELDYMVSNARITGYGGYAHGYSSDHLSVAFNRMAANADVQLLNAHDGNRAWQFATDLGQTYMVVGNTTAGKYGHFRLQPRGSGFYRIYNNTTKLCLRDGPYGSVIQSVCNNDDEELFDLRGWSDTPQIQIKLKNRNTCLGDDPAFGWGSQIITTDSCSGGETRLNFRFDYDPGPGAARVVF